VNGYLVDTFGSRANELKYAMQIEDYFDFVSADEIRLRGTRIGIEAVLSEYRSGVLPEEIVINYPPVTLEQVHAAITYYLGHRSAMEQYLSRWISNGETALEQQRQSDSPLLARLIAARRSATPVWVKFADAELHVSSDSSRFASDLELFKLRGVARRCGIPALVKLTISTEENVAIHSKSIRCLSPGRRTREDSSLARTSFAGRGCLSSSRVIKPINDQRAHRRGFSFHSGRRSICRNAIGVRANDGLQSALLVL
jgi:uncharacterized protein (DUF433 family)